MSIFPLRYGLLPETRVDRQIKSPKIIKNPTPPRPHPRRTPPTDLQRVDERQVVERDVVVIVLDVAERLLVVAHQRVDLAVLALLDLVHLRPPPQLQLVALRSHLALVLLLQLARLALERAAQLRHQFVLALRQATRIGMRGGRQRNRMRGGRQRNRMRGGRRRNRMRERRRNRMRGRRRGNRMRGGRRRNRMRGGRRRNRMRVG